MQRTLLIALLAALSITTASDLLPSPAHVVALRSGEVLPINGTRDGAAAFPRRLALVTVLSDGHYMERDREAISLMNCFSIRHGVPYYVETHGFGSNWYNKQLALRKYLPLFDWIMYVDADTYIMDRVHGYGKIMSYLDVLDQGGYHMAFSELHHSGVGGFDAGVVLIRNSAIGSKFNDAWLAGAERPWRNADNGFLNIVFLRWVLGPTYDGRCDGLLHKYWYYPNGTAFPGIQVRELSKEAVRAYRHFFPCFYSALGLEWKPYESARMRLVDAAGRDNRTAWRPFYISYWDELGVLSCAYPRRVSGRMKHDPIPCSKPIVYHAKDVAERFWSTRKAPNVTSGGCI